MTGSDVGRDPVERLAEEFVARHRRGERPSLSEYTDRHPEWAEQIRDLFPALLAIERLKPDDSGGTDDHPAAVPPPELLGDFRILREVGRGGMGVVYEAEQLSLGRRVALKVLPSGMLGGGPAPPASSPPTQDPRIARFHFEARAVGRLHHTNIVPVYGVGEADGLHYYVMQFIPGRGLDQVLEVLRRQQNNPPDTSSIPSTETTYWRAVARIGLQAAEALDHAHRQGIIHRDVKPSNLLLDAQGTAWVTDFGLAKGPDGDNLTRSGDVIGTLRYLAPERFDGTADPRSDVYALGLTLYELLTLRPAFDASDRNALVRAVMGEEPPRPRRINPEIPRDLETVVLKAIERDPARRYQTAADLAADLRRFLADEPVKARRAGPLERLWRVCRRNRVVATLTAAVVLLLLGSAVGGLVLSLHLWAALDQAREADREKTDKLWLSHYERARAGRFSRQMGQRLDSLAALEEAARIRPDERLRDEAIAAMALCDVRRVPGWNSNGVAVTPAPVFDGMYRLCARLDGPGAISVRTVPEDREVLHIASGLGSLNHLLVSPDGRFVGTIGGPEATLRVWRLAGGAGSEGQRPTALSHEPVGCCCWDASPDSRHLAVGLTDGSVLRFNLETGQEVNRFRVPAPPHRLAFHPDNRRLAVGYARSGVVSVYDAADGKPLAELPVGEMAEMVVAWHPDGEHLAVSGSDPRIQIWDVGAKRQLAVLGGHAQQVTHLSFHPDGGLLASWGWEGVVRLWEPSTARQLMQLPLNGHAQFSRDGRWLGYAIHGERLDLLEVIPSREYRTMVSSDGAGKGGYYAGDISPDGRLLALGMDTGLRLWDLPSGRELARLPGITRTALFHVMRGASDPDVVRGSPDPAPPGHASWELLTSDRTGLHRWPVRRGGGRFQFGPPQQLSHLFRADFTPGAQGRTRVAVYAADAPIQVLDLEQGLIRHTLGTHPDGDGMHGLSPDGRFLASCGWLSDRVRLWDIEKKQMVREWIYGGHMKVCFSPNSRTLVISRSGEYRFHDVTTGELIRRLPREVSYHPVPAAFSPDGLVALEMAPGVIHLLSMETARVVARLEDPHGDPATWLSFTPDSTQLVTASVYAKAIHVWDLRAIRTRLKEMNLDWDWPEYAPLPSPGVAPPGLPPGVAPPGLPPGVAPPGPPVVTVDPGYLQYWEDFPDAREAVALLGVSLALQPQNPEALLQRARAYGQLAQEREAAGDCTAFLLLAPPGDRRRAEVLCRRAYHHQSLGNEAAALSDLLALTHLDTRDVPYLRMLAQRFNSVAWRLVTPRPGELRATGAEIALPLAKKAVEIYPREPWYRNTLAVVYYRLDRWREAAEVLEANLVDRPEQAAFDLYFLAMCHHRLGDPARARDCFDRAVRWHEEKAAGLSENHRADLKAFRAEAEALLRQQKTTP